MLIEADLCVIGAGSAGLSIAAASSQLGAKTVLIEADRMGGDCLNAGCVPSKSLLAAARVAHIVKGGAQFGICADQWRVDYPKVRDHVHAVIAAIAPHDSEERFRSLGCIVIRAHARFAGPMLVQAGDARIKARRFVVATGSRPTDPPIPGLKNVPYLTNETIFAIAEKPAHLIVLGAGPIGCELAQAFRRLGSEITLLDKGALLSKDDPDAAAVIRDVFEGEGISIAENVNVDRVEARGDGVEIVLADGRRVVGSHLLVATGRQPNIANMDLDGAGIAYSAAGIKVDRRLRTTNRRIYAAGDVVGGPQFTHWAGYHAGIVIRNALFRLPSRVNASALTWTTFTDPEVAQVGLTEGECRHRFGAKIRVLSSPFSRNDRARAEGKVLGFAKVMTDSKGRILGATIVGSSAGELIQSWALATSSRLRIKSMAEVISPYPTLGEINKRVAGDFYASSLFGPRTRWLVRLLRRLG